MLSYKINQELNRVASFLLLGAISKFDPQVKLGNYQVDATGFFLDFKFTKSPTLTDLHDFEKVVLKFLKGNAQIVLANSEENMFNYFDPNAMKNTKVFKLVNSNDKSTIFSSHFATLDGSIIKQIRHFKLINIAGAYWQNDAKNEQLTRISGIAFAEQTEFTNWQKALEETQARDHRKLGRELDIYAFSNLAGQGFPFWLKNGLIIKNKIQKFLRQKEREYDFEEVFSPAYGSKELYEKSGHWDHYKNEMFPPVTFDDESIVMRPMTCPHHVLIYQRTRKSYRDFPIRIAEHARLYRYEKSGALTGLERVRSMELTDAHIFVREDQIKSEFKRCYRLISEVLAKFQIEIDHIALSLRDPLDREKYFDDDAMWDKAEKWLEEALQDLKISYTVEKGEAAFYGPKLDIQVKTALGHIITLSTLQLDFLLPTRFGITYVDHEEKFQQPVMIHRGLIGTYERFMAIILEQNKGIFPFWLAPEQAIVIPVDHTKHFDYAQKVHKQLVRHGFDSVLDASQERLGKKIRNAQVRKIKYQIIVGDKEIQENNLSVRAHGAPTGETLTLDQLLSKFASLVE